MRYFNFDSLIDKYSTEFTVVVSTEGHYELGKYKPGEKKEITMSGAIVSFTENKIFRSAGTITQQDKALFMKERIDRSLQDATVIYGGKVYHIGSELENYEFTGVYAYTLKFVSNFDEEGVGNGG